MVLKGESPGDPEVGWVTRSRSCQLRQIYTPAGVEGAVMKRPAAACHPGWRSQRARRSPRSSSAAHPSANPARHILGR